MNIMNIIDSYVELSIKKDELKNIIQGNITNLEQKNDGVQVVNTSSPEDINQDKKDQIDLDRINYLLSRSHQITLLGNKKLNINWVFIFKHHFDVFDFMVP